MSNDYGSIRRSQLITTWGIGQMIDLPGNDSLMLSGLEAWNRNFGQAEDLQEFIFNDHRLSKRLGVKHFRLPPEFRKSQRYYKVENPNLTVPFVRFPLWYYCPNCGYMERQHLNTKTHPVCARPNYSKGRTCHDLKWAPPLVPVRFIAACEKGHLEDFPFSEWVHEGKHCNSTELRWTEGRSPDLAAIWISCSSCGSSKSLLGIMNPERLGKVKLCSGNRPWLGEINNNNCGSSLIALQKGASNLYFPLIKTSIYIPAGDSPKDKLLNKIMDDPSNWDFLKVKGADGLPQKENVAVIASRYAVDLNDLIKAVTSRISDESTLSDENRESATESEYRQYEFDFFLSNTNIHEDEIVVENVAIESFDLPFQQLFSTIKKIKKLRETMAFCGFSRINPPESGRMWDYKKELSKTTFKSWLPAVWSRGEGIFLEFNLSSINLWMQDSSIVSRAFQILDGKEHFDKSQSIDSAYVLIHTFSHMLINRLSFSCGYGSSSLRERIYYSNNGSIDMAGILIYATGDSEGTLGGLVRMAEPQYFESMVANTLQDAQWCSSDPLCMESTGQGPDTCNLAACHNCAVISETSCENANRFLDRKLLVGGQVGKVKDITGYFSNILG